MLKLIESAFLMGLGATSFTVKKAEDFVNSAIANKDLTKEEGNQLLQTLVDEGKKAEEQIKAKVSEILDSRGESLLPYYKKLSELEAKIAELEAKVATLENK